MRTLGMFVKHPVAGLVKTRLAAALGENRAAAIYETFVADLVERFRTTADRRVLCITPADVPSRDYFTAASAGSYELWPQPNEQLGERMAVFFRTALASKTDSAVLIGSDSPTLPREFVERAFDVLETSDCVFGPAMDGGYYLIGQRSHYIDLFKGITWSQGDVLARTMNRVKLLGSQVSLLPPWYDVDDLRDWEMLKGHLSAMALAGDPSLPAATWTLLKDEASPMVP